MMHTHLSNTLRPLFVLFATISVLSLSPRAAAADPLRIDSGFLFVSNDTEQSFGLDFGLDGDGFSFIGEYGHTRDYLVGFSPESFRLLFSPTEALESCSTCSSYGGDFIFEAPGPPPGGWRAFTMRGTLGVFAPGATQASVRHDLVGSGRMSSNAPVSALYQFESAAAPVPEPTTMMLLCSGLVAAFHAARRRPRTDA